ncbi:MAG: hypothetical protein HGA43_08305 [Nitrospirae bacterium]|nr:hypothetical protein [Nitrospirota bacterium]
MKPSTARERVFRTILPLPVLSFFLVSSLYTANAADRVAAGKMPTETSHLWSPGKLAVDSHMVMYVVDSYKGRVQMFDSNGSHLGTISVALPSAVAAGPEGTLYIGSHKDYSVAIYRNGERTGSLGDGSREFSSVRDIAVDPITGDIYVVDAGKNTVKIYFASGHPKGSLSGFNMPSGVAITGDEIYILDAPVVRPSGSQVAGTGSRISVFSKSWTFLRSIEEYGRDGDQMTRPVGIAADGRGNVFIADASKKAVLVYSRQGEYTGQFVSAEGDLNTAVALAVSPDGQIYVSSSETHCIIEISPARMISSEMKASIEFKSKTGKRQSPGAPVY